VATQAPGSASVSSHRSPLAPNTALSNPGPFGQIVPRHVAFAKSLESAGSKGERLDLLDVPLDSRQAARRRATGLILLARWTAGSEMTGQQALWLWTGTAAWGTVTPKRCCRRSRPAKGPLEERLARALVVSNPRVQSRARLTQHPAEGFHELRKRSNLIRPSDDAGGPDLSNYRYWSPSSSSAPAWSSPMFCTKVSWTATSGNCASYR